MTNQGPVSGYELVTDKKVLAQPATLAVERLAWSRRGGLGPFLQASYTRSMSLRLAELLGTVLAKPVVDATHLQQDLDIKLAWRPDTDAEWRR